MPNPDLSPPLPLRFFTFLFNDRPAPSRDLCHALCARDPGLLWMDLEEPFRNATLHLLYGGFSLEHDLTEATQRAAQIPFGSKTISNEKFIDALTLETQHILGASIRGEIALQRHMEDGDDLFYQRIIYRDAKFVDDVVPFVTKFGPHNIDCIFAGELISAHNFPSGIRHTWLPEPGLESRLRRLEKELSVLQP
jgi:hypothetical protein